MKILYNVTIAIDKTIEKEWINWMTNNHIPDVMATGKFISYALQKIISTEKEPNNTYAIQYLCQNLQTFEEYQDHFASKLQKEHTNKYKGKFAAFRTLMEVLKQG